MLRSSWYLYICVLLNAAIMTACDEESPERPFPRVRTLEVTDINSEGATFNGEVSGKRTNIIRYGFVWSQSEEPTLTSSNQLIFEGQPGGIFSREVSASLAHGQTYFVKAFVQTEEHLIYGDQVYFESKGSLPPVITSISPKLGTWGDTVSISGQFFSQKIEENQVFFDDNTAQVVVSTDTLIKVLAPEIPIKDEGSNVSLRVSIFGKKANLEPTFTYFSSELLYFFPTEATFNDTIKIFGKNLPNNPEFVNVKFGYAYGTLEAQIISTSKESLQLIVPTSINTSPLPLVLDIAGRQYTTEETFDLLAPLIENFSPAEITQPEVEISITGKYFNPSMIGNRVYFDNSRGTITSATASLITCIVPPSVIPNDFMSVDNKQVTISVEVAQKWVDGNDKLTVNYDGAWSEKGSFPGNRRSGAIAVSINGIGYFGLGGTNTQCFKDFWSYDPNNDQWKREMDLPGKARKEASAFVLDGRVYVGLGVNRPLDDYYPYNDWYRFDPATGVWEELNPLPAHGRADAGVMIHDNEVYLIGGDMGNNSENGSSHSNKTFKYKPATDQWEEISPFMQTSNDAVGFTLNNQGYLFNYSTLYRFDDSGWNLVLSNIEGWSDVMAFAIDGIGYFGFGNDHHGGTDRFYEFDPSKETVVRRYFHIGYSDRRYSSASFTIDDKAYMIGGYTFNGYRNDVWEFDPSKLMQ